MLRTDAAPAARGGATGHPDPITVSEAERQGTRIQSPFPSYPVISPENAAGVSSNLNPGSSPSTPREVVVPAAVLVGLDQLTPMSTTAGSPQDAATPGQDSIDGLTDAFSATFREFVNPPPHTHTPHTHTHLPC